MAVPAAVTARLTVSVPATVREMAPLPELTIPPAATVSAPVWLITIAPEAVLSVAARSLRPGY